jgi:hypothetical protein
MFFAIWFLMLVDGLVGWLVEKLKKLHLLIMLQNALKLNLLNCD